MDDPKPGRKDTQSFAVWPLLVLLVGAMVLLLVLQMRRPRPGGGGGGDSLVGQPLPPLSEVGGWLNSEPLTADELRGQVVLVDYWATWCGPCRVNMPHLAKLHETYRDQGLVVLGITSEPTSERDAIEAYVESVAGMDWPIAYGGQMVLEIMGIRFLPTLVLYDRSGTSVWSGHSEDGLEDAVVAALARK